MKANWKMIAIGAAVLVGAFVAWRLWRRYQINKHVLDAGNNPALSSLFDTLNPSVKS